ncbi:hypothetical protein K469DRAFT_687714 [Zopfia rhizophila CBS 207.26]|uniref:NACHT domain-containing protein n=1 Tax=Zopfia rhizophila CBS 207.26 TaxID=1314779 RepID=A0A6A6E277_9PEZI|nr:hypothetical protein K469DRAFT_687714 [Zopfia rhizophila CBS 207.26]
MSPSAEPRGPKHIFEEACAAFRSALTEDDRKLFKEFESAQSMLQEIGNHAKTHPVHHSRLTKCCKKIHGLAEKLSQYFEIINIFIQSNPEFAALAWGSLRLIFLVRNSLDSFELQLTDITTANKLGSNHILFLERICEMFENMGMLLPAYEEYATKMQARAQQQQKDTPDRLLKALAYIYTDLLQFCFDACKLLSKKSSRFLCLKSSFANSMNWTPFDVRYDQLLKRWKEHNQLMYLEMRVSSHVEQMESAAKLEEMLRKIEEKWGAQNEHTATLESKTIDRRLRQLIEWINPPKWTDLFEVSQSRRSPHTTNWFWDQASVKQWLSQHGSSAGESPLNMLSVQVLAAKPGYGKTTLCTALIENLQMGPQQTFQVGVPADIAQESLAFFYFDKQRPDSIQPTHALRAILAQLLHILRKDKDAIDILTIIWDQNQTGQLTAANNEISSALNLIMRRSGRLFLLFDGVDECTDQDAFFDFLTQMSYSPIIMSIALFSRPTIKIPNKLKQHCLLLNPGSLLNSSDIRTFLRPKIECLREDATLSSTVTVDIIVGQICERANGMFLWARLFISYLQSPMLSVRQRSEAMENMNRLEGLDSLYRAILESLEHQYSRQAKDNISRAFQLVAFAYRPLTVKELQYALAITPDRKMQPEDIIPNFAADLIRMSGALMETTSDNTVRFIHLSVLEYLLDPANTHAEFKSFDARTSMNRASGHRSCACCCLSYLYHSVEHEPLGGSAQAAPDRNIQTNRYPFLEYAAKYWSLHLLDLIQMLSQSPAEMEEEINDSIAGLASKFFSSPEAITVWIEASYMFGFLPEVGMRPNQKQLFDDSPANSSPESLRNNAVRCLQRLSQDLRDLNSSWAEVLSNSPNEIWEPSVSAFAKSPFWVSVYGSKISQFRSKNKTSETSICLKSQVSSDGRLLGVARLRIRPPDFTDFSVVYELWAVHYRELLFQDEIRIPEWTPFIQSIDNPRDSRIDSAFCFHFPVAMSADLSRIAVPGCVAKVDGECLDDLEDIKHCSMHFQPLSFSLPGHATDDLLPFNFSKQKFSESYALQISESGEFLFTLHKSLGLVEISPRIAVTLCLVTVYQDNSPKPNEKPDYRYMTSIAFKPDELGIVLHPYLPMAGFKHRGIIIVCLSKGKQQILENRGEGTILWDFANQGRRRKDPITFLDTGERKLRFSDCGRYFCDLPLSSFRVFQECVDSEMQSSNRRKYQGDVVPHSKSVKSRTLASTLSHSRPLNENKPAVQTAGTLIGAADATGMHAISDLEQVTAGAVILQTLREDGLMTSATLTQLPAWAADAPAALLNSQDDDSDNQRDMVRIVLNQPGENFQKYYISAQSRARPVELPVILERKRDTIPIFYGRGACTDQGEIRFTGEVRKRLGPDDGGVSKRIKQ